MDVVLGGPARGETAERAAYLISSLRTCTVVTGTAQH